MAWSELNADITHPTKNIEPLNDMIAKALMEPTNELFRTKKVNEMLKTKLTEIRSELESAMGDLGATNLQKRARLLVDKMATAMQAIHARYARDTRARSVEIRPGASP